MEIKYFVSSPFDKGTAVQLSFVATEKNTTIYTGALENISVLGAMATEKV